MLPDSRPPDLLSAYLAGDLAEFFQLRHDDVQGALELARDVDRGALTAAIRPHARRLGASSKALDNLERLAHPRAMAVVTGQQAGLLLGPTYTLSKALAAVRLAERLDSEDRPVVPVFWVASQDHDVAEVDHAYLLDASESLRRVDVDLPDGVAVGRIPLRAPMLEAVAAALAQHTPRGRCEAEVMAVLEAAASVSESFADWFSAQLYGLLADTGIVVVDPLVPEVAALSARVLEREVLEPLAGPERVNAAGRSLKRLGFAPQLGRAEGATNLFVEVGGGAGLPRRQLLRADGGSFVAGGERFTRRDLLEVLASDPTAVTPAAGLRPVVQDAILPTVATVVGPGELAYFAQLRGVYELHGVPMSLAWPRASVTVLEPAAARLLAAYGLTAARFRADPEGALESVLLARHGAAGEFNRATNELEEAFETLLAHVEAIDPTLRGTVRRGRRNLAATVSRLRGKSAAALARRDGETRGQFERLHAHLLPLGQPSERVLSPYSHVLKFGLAPLQDRLALVGEAGDHELRL